MKYFTVEREELTGTQVSGEIFADGEYVNLPSDTEMRTVTTGFSVFEYGEDGMTQRVEFYPVKIDTESWATNEDEVLEQIKADHPAGEWQNNNW